MQDDSSSEETPNNAANTKPIVPPRPRNLAFDHKSKLINNNNNSAGTAAKQRMGSHEDYEVDDRKWKYEYICNM